MCIGECLFCFLKCFWLFQIVDIVVSKEAKFGDFVGPR
jgi:hypothetical protein